jgi:hypothetical protein
MAPNTKELAVFLKRFRPSWPSPTRYIGGGVNGRVFETTNGRLIKLVARYAPQEWASLLRLQGTYTVPRFKKNNHVNFQINWSNKQDANIATKISRILKMPLGDGFTAFVMGSVGGGKAMTLDKYVRKFPQTNRAKIQDRVKYLIDEMHVRGISHGNLHGENVLVTAGPGGRITGMWAIDFGRSTKIPAKATEREHYSRRPASSVHRTLSLFRNKEAHIPVFNGSRMNAHLAQVHYGRNYTRENEAKIAKMRASIKKNLKLLKIPKKITSVRKTKSL